MPNSSNEPQRMPVRTLNELISEHDPEFFEKQDVPAYEFKGRTFYEREGHPAGYGTNNSS